MRLAILLLLTAKPGLPPPDDACKTADDCAHQYVYLIDGRCCSGTCSPTAVSKASAKATQKACESIGWEDDKCPAKKCAAPPPLVCKAGHCALGK